MEDTGCKSVINVGEKPSTARASSDLSLVTTCYVNVTDVVNANFKCFF